MTDASESIDLQEGLRQSAAGETVSLGSFAKYADDIDLAELEQLAKATLEKPEPSYMTPFDYPAEVDESNLDDLTQYLFDAGVDWAKWNSASTLLALIARVHDTEARIEKMVRLRDRIELVRDEVEDLAHDVRETLSILTEGDE